MHPNAERVQSVLSALGAQGRVVELQDSTRTSAEAAAAIGTTVAQIAKSLVFMVDEQPVLIIASGTNRVSTTKAGALLGGTLHRPDGDTVKRTTGFPIGGIPPVGHTSALRVLIDQDLLQFADIWAAAGTPNAVFPSTPTELVRITGGQVADIKE